ncbi:hypothetical protein BBJ28_00001964 [Nothophytophthora sp. Chile5]|nr:hypothetical protein BBJ28_00001964 [Nothophytophthora sp. Chile5]
MQMLNVSALITGYDTVGDHTEFIAEVRTSPAPRLLRAPSCNDFDQLHSRLVGRFGDLIEVSLPEKQWFGRFFSPLRPPPRFRCLRFHPLLVDCAENSFACLYEREVRRVVRYWEVSSDELADGLGAAVHVPGILDDASSLLHFLELEKHLALHGDVGTTGTGSNGRSSGLWPSKDGMSENDRLSGIVENAAQAFIDISEVPEPLEAEQAVQRKNEIVAASQSLLNEQKLADQFSAQLTTLRLPRVSTQQPSNEELLARLEGGDDDDMSYDQEQEFLWATLESVEASLRVEITPPSIDLLAVMSSSLAATPAAIGSNGSNAVEGNGLASMDERGSIGNGIPVPSFG